MELQLKQNGLLQEVKEGIKVGDLFFDKRGEEIIRIQEIEEKQYRKDDPSTKYLLVSYKRLVSFVENKWTDPYHSSLKELNNYYSLNSPIANLDDLYKRGLDAQINGIQDYEVSSSFEASTELVAMNSKENLLAMKDSIEILQSKTTQLQKMLNFQLCEMKEKINLMNNIEQSQETLRLIYDDELCLPTNRLPFAEWKKMINSTIEEGSRIVYCPSIENRWKSPKQRLYEERFLKSYSEWSLPTFPGEGVYTVYKTFINDIYWKEHKRIEEKREQLGIRYIPDDPRWDWNGSHERKNSLFLNSRKMNRQSLITINSILMILNFISIVGLIVLIIWNIFQF